MPDTGERLENIRRLRMWTQARLAREAGVSPTTVSGIETGKIGRPHFGTLGKLARALGVAPGELLDSHQPVEQQGPASLSLAWARETGPEEFESGLEDASLDSLDSPYRANWTPSRAASKYFSGCSRGQRAEAVRKASDPRGSGAVGISEGYCDGPPQPG